jgi:transposase
VSESFIEKLKQRRREHGAVVPKPHAGGRQPLLAAQSELIRAQLHIKPDTTLQELRDGLGLSVSLSTLWYHLRRLGLRFKKSLKAAAQKCRVCVDDTGRHTALVCEWGWGPRAKPGGSRRG